MPLTLTQKVAHIWRSWTDPLAATLVAHEPVKSEIRFWGGWVERSLERLEEGGFLQEETADDLSGSLLYGNPIVATGVNTGAATLTVPLNHGLCTGMPVYVAATAGSAIADTIYWVIRDPLGLANKIKLAISYDNAMAGTAMALAAGTTPSMRIHRDPLQRIVKVDALERKKDGSEGGSIVGPLTGMITPKTFGASVDAADNSLALQMALHWVRTSYDVDAQVYTASGDGQSVVYRHTRSLQAGQIRPPGFRFDNLSLNPATDGKVALDVSGQNTAVMRGLSIEGDLTLPPSVGRFGSRVHSALTDATNTSPVPSASDNDYSFERITGSFTKAPVIEVNCDLNTHAHSKYENRSREALATGPFVCTTQAAIVRHFGAEIISPFWPVPDATWTPASVGTITFSDWTNCNSRRPHVFSITPTAINATATPIILTFAATGTESLVDNAIVNDERITLSALNNNFTLQEENYRLKNIVGNTAELWTEDGSAQVNHATASVSGGAVAGPYTTGRVVNRQGPCVCFAGPMERVAWSGYALNFSRAAMMLDLTDGDMDGIDISIHAENAITRTIDIVPHATDPRRLGNAKLHISGDLVFGGHFWLRAGGVVNIDGDINIDGPQTGTPSAVLNSLVRVFRGNLSNLHFDGKVRTTLSDLLANISSLGRFRATVYDAEDETTTVYPQGTYAPTFTAVTNLDSITALGVEAWHFSTNGKRVDVYGRFTADATAAGSCVFNVSPPIASNLVAGTLVGMGQRQGVSTEQCSIVGETTLDLAQVTFNAATTSSFNGVVMFSYMVS